MRVCLAVVALGCCFTAVAVGEPSSRPDASDTAHALFLKRMGEKGVELGLEASYYENASGLTKKSRTCAADLLKLGLAAVANPTLARIWAATNRTVSIGGPHARQERLVHGYTTLKGYPAFARRYPFLGGKGGSLSYSDLTVRAHVILTEVRGVRLLIALAGQRCEDDPFALDLEICDLVAAELAGSPHPAIPRLEALEASGGGYAYATLDGRIRRKSPHARRPQVPASTTKIMTALCCLDLVRDVSRKMTIRKRDIVGGSGYACQDGDEITYEDALYSMMLPSSNTLAESVATGAGEFLLKDFEKGTER